MPAGWLRSAGVLYAALWALTLTTAAATALIGALGELAHQALGLALEPHAATLGLAAGTFAHNLTAAGWPFLLPRLFELERRGGRRAAAAVLTVYALVQTVLVGAAIGAYGGRVVPFLVHLPIEWAALAVPLAHVLERAHTRRPRIRAEIARRVLVFAVLLAIAALIETYVTPTR